MELQIFLDLSNFKSGPRNNSLLMHVKTKISSPATNIKTYITGLLITININNNQFKITIKKCLLCAILIHKKKREVKTKHMYKCL